MATTTGPTPLPPTSTLSSRPITQSEAHDFLTAYLDRSTSDPSLQPNAVLSEHGPISRNTTAAPSLVLHNLKRVQAGLGGEVLGKDMALEMFMSQEKERKGAGKKWFEEEIEAFRKGGEGEGEGEGGDEEEGWGDKREFEVQQQDGDGKGDDDEVDVNVEGGGEVEVGEDGMPPKIDKEERKRKKKEKRKEEKRAKAPKG
ncbi:hypothetical protein FQN54_007357 [Arachnomyces sp. PD_36]|nr:hypothetical protein FQN54_007357 [Arachnomyces sp. PD_36]